jgi:hypothetical protein
MSKLIANLTDQELSDLAQLYVSAVNDADLPLKLLYVMAHRLDPGDLGRLSSHFGFAQVRAAIVAMAPSKPVEFQIRANPDDPGLTPGAMRFGATGRFATPISLRPESA